MKKTSDYIGINKKSWNERTPLHVKSDFYNVAGFLEGNTSLNDIELNLLGEIRNKSILHLQCHFGMDSISLARMGAKVTGVDFSDTAIAQAGILNDEAGQDVEFICSDIYALNLEKEFDFVFSSYGVIGWLPDMHAWARIISKHLKPGGKLIFVEFHPVVWIFDNKFQKIEYNYFKDGEIHESETGTYADKESKLNIKTVTWNHGLSEVLGSLMTEGLAIKEFNEYDYSPYNCFEETNETEKGKFRIKHLGNKIPMIYSLLAEKR